MFAGKKSAQIREILISESAWEEMTCLFAPSLEVRDDIERRAYEIALVSLEVEPDEREAYELFMEKRFGDLVDRRRAKNGDNEYMAWDMTLGWIVWQQRAGIHFSTMSQQEVK